MKPIQFRTNLIIHDKVLAGQLLSEYNFDQLDGLSVEFRNHILLRLEHIYRAGGGLGQDYRAVTSQERFMSKPWSATYWRPIQNTVKYYHPVIGACLLIVPTRIKVIPQDSRLTLLGLKRVKNV